jgi:hypothetical protein
MYSTEAIEQLQPIESETLDYKAELELSSDDKKQEFLLDIVSFLNYQGGQIFVGVDEIEGRPKFPIKGIDLHNLDTLKQKIENLLRDSIEPRIQGIQMNPKELNGTPCLEIVIPNGYEKPYQVKFRKHIYYFSRNSVGKFPMNRNQIKQMFLLSGQINVEIKKFIAERLEFMAQEQYLYSYPYENSAAVVMHLLPHSSFHSQNLFNLTEISSKYPSCKIFCNQGEPMWNNDGLIYRSWNNDEYLQIFRNGSIEALSTNPNMVGNVENSIEVKQIIPSTLFVNNITQTLLPTCFRIFKDLGLPLPVSVNTNILNAKGLQFAAAGKYWRGQHIFTRDILKLVSSQINSYDDEPHIVLRPVFDSLWNTFGHPGL